MDMTLEKRAIDQVEGGLPPNHDSAPSTVVSTAAAATDSSSPAGLVVDQLIQPGRRPKKQKVQEIPPVPKKPGQCHFYVKGKGRYCKLRAKVTHKYCGEHSMLEGTDDHDTKLPGTTTATAADTSLPAGQEAKGIRKRVPCPLDPSHTVWQDDLASHTARCNARPRGSIVHVQDINLTLPAPSESHLAQDMLSKLTPVELLALVTKVEALCDKYIPSIPTIILDHPVMDERKKIIKNIKHAHQQGSLLGHMARLGLLSEPRACFVEFGAGRGELSHYLKQAVQDRGTATFVLIDRMAVRNKFDSYIAGHDQVPKSFVARRLVDIKDLDLAAVPETRQEIGSVVEEMEQEKKRQGEELQDDKKEEEEGQQEKKAGGLVGKRRPVVALSKHLCGGATDMTLKCLVDYQALSVAGRQERSKETTAGVRGIVIALCCHHCCRHYMYPNQAFLDECGISAHEFALITRMSSWGVSVNTTAKALGSVADETRRVQEQKSDKEKEGAEEEEEEEEEHGLVDNAAQDLGSNISVLTFQRRVELGLRCKRLLDVGRVKYLEQHGFDAQLVYYTDPDTSLENLALMAVPK